MKISSVLFAFLFSLVLHYSVFSIISTKNRKEKRFYAVKVYFSHNKGNNLVRKKRNEKKNIKKKQIISNEKKKTLNFDKNKSKEIEKTKNLDSDSSRSDGGERNDKEGVTFSHIRVEFEKPNYPFFSRELGEEGDVYVEVVVGKKDNLLSLKIYKSSGYKRLDRAVLNALKNARFFSAERNGKKIKSREVLGPFKFRLRDE